MHFSAFCRLNMHTERKGPCQKLHIWQGLALSCIKVPPGFEPGMADLQSAAASSQGMLCQDVAAASSLPLAHSLAREVQTDPDLARLIEAWPILPPTVKRMILAAIGNDA